MSSFEQAHNDLIAYHEELRKGERKRRLVRGHDYAEKLMLQNVWWPVFGHFEYLHPEYEVLDWNRKSVYLDFAFLPPFGRFGIECDGFQSHIKDMDREKHSYAVNRDTFLTGMGWRMLHFTVDDIKYRPEICRMLLKLCLAPYLINNQTDRLINARDREVLQLSWSLGRNIRPKDVSNALNINHRTAVKRLHSLVEQKLLLPVKNGRDVRQYKLAEGALEKLF
ncbi:endonuclease domain-containing protein [Paenibacillus sp. N4]|uniref:endonuclease domain-containing protein n=1 Tax=Paenibacillus vietnamensis TaxID=2590547 RepID=UPI001CD09077|nr:endonuclease domain-containing protein [Paenibacillus vietnamensis]MCA0756821.1 endonuclease domain-containing protein [Paenibacillus vietnamensis]